MVNSNTDLAARLRPLDLEQRLSVMQQLIDSIPDSDARIRQTFQTFLNESKTDEEAMEITIERLAGYWKKYNDEHPVTL